MPGWTESFKQGQYHPIFRCRLFPWEVKQRLPEYPVVRSGGERYEMLTYMEAIVIILTQSIQGTEMAEDPKERKKLWTKAG